MNGGSGGSRAVAGSGDEAVGSMVDANDERWEKLFALSAAGAAPWTLVLSGLKGRAQRQEELARRGAGLATVMIQMMARMLLYLLN